MGQQKEVVRTGDSPAVGFSGNLIDFLSEQFFGGTGPGAVAAGDGPERTGNIQSFLNDILGAGGGNVGGAIQENIQNQVEDEVGATRSRFGASGGTSRGTPAAVAESFIRSRSAPLITEAIGGLQIPIIQALLQLGGGVANKGLPNVQDNLLIKENPLLSGLKGLGGLSGSLASILAALPTGGSSLLLPAAIGGSTPSATTGTTT